MVETQTTSPRYKSEKSMADQTVAIIKFNGGNGALLCNRCRRILTTGFDHEDREHLCQEYGIACLAEEDNADD